MNEFKQLKEQMMKLAVKNFFIKKMIIKLFELNNDLTGGVETKR